MASYNDNRRYTDSNPNLPPRDFPPPPLPTPPDGASGNPGGNFYHNGTSSHPSRLPSPRQGPTKSNDMSANSNNAVGSVTSSMNNMSIDTSNGTYSAVANSPRNPPLPPPPGSSRIASSSANQFRPPTQLPATPGRIVPRPLGSFSGPPPSPSFGNNGRGNNYDHFPPPPAPASAAFVRQGPLPPYQQNHRNSGNQTIQPRSVPPTVSNHAQITTGVSPVPVPPPPPSPHTLDTNTNGQNSHHQFHHHQHEQDTHSKPPSQLPPKPPMHQLHPIPQKSNQYHQNNQNFAPSPPKPPVPPPTATGNRLSSPFPIPPSASTPIQQHQNLQHHTQPPPPPLPAAAFHDQMPRPPSTPSQNQQLNQLPPKPSHMQSPQQQYFQQHQQQQQQPPFPPHSSQNFHQNQQKEQDPSYTHHHPNQPPPPPQFSQQQQYPPPPLQQPHPPYHQHQHQYQHDHQQSYPTHHQQPYSPHHQKHQQPMQEKDKIDPSQIPRIPLFTRPHHAPAMIYPSKSTPGSHNISNVTSMIADPPPPSDARYTLSSSNFINPSPRIMRSTVHTFPLDNATSRKCDLPLGVVVTPLAGLTSMCAGAGGNGLGGNGTGDGNSNEIHNRREQGDIYNDDDDDIAKKSEVDYIPLDSEHITDPERISVLRGPRRTATPQIRHSSPNPHSHSHPSSHLSHSDDRHPDPSSTSPRAIQPPRCTRCNAYLNPYCSPVSTSSSLSSAFRTIGAYTPIQSYDCNMCGARGSISLTEEYIANGTVDMATRCGTIEYEVGGAYCVRDRPVENVHLYGVEYAPFGCGRLGDSAGGEKNHHHHGTLESHGWKESLDAILEVGRCLRKTSPVKEAFGKDSTGNVTTTSAPVKIGVFAFCLDMLIFPYMKKRKHSDHSNGDPHQDLDEEDIAVAIVSDIAEDPFCPLPLDMWTYDIGDRCDDRSWKRFCRIIDSFSGLMEELLGDSLLSVSSSSEMPAKWMRNCGGAALVAFSDALKDSGGRATLITTRRPNYGVGALRDREAGQQSHYLRKECEQRLITPVQRVPNISAINGNDADMAAGQFYRKLGEDFAKYRVSLDIVVTNAVLSMPVSSMGSGQSQRPNMREYLDVATLSELCRVTCGKFKWLRVGNECGIAVGGDDSDTLNLNDSFTAEQLREELMRSALTYSGSDVVFKLRCSNGVQVKSYSPSLPLGTIVGDGIVDSAELEMSRIDSSTSIAVLVEHKVGGVVNTRESGKTGNETPLVFFQSAVLYTTMTGRRRVRVSTLGLMTSKVPADVFRSADLGTVTTFLTRQAISDLDRKDEGSLHVARDNVFQNCVSILANYRIHTTARTSPESQLILPESLQLLPLFCLSLRKNRMFRHSLHKTMPSAKPFPTADERAYHISYGRMVSPNLALQNVHPNLLQISDMRTRDGEWITPPTLETNNFVDEEVIAASMRPVCQLPKSMNPSISCLDGDGMYILDDRFAFYLFVGTNVAEEKWREFFSVSAENNYPNNTGVPLGRMALAGTESAHKLRNILQQLRMLNSPNTALGLNARPTHAPLILVFVGRGSVFEEEMDSLLIDDPDSHEKSYVDFLCAIHRSVREKIGKING